MNCSGMITAKDCTFLRKVGVAAIFGPGTSIPIASEVLDIVRTARSDEDAG